MTLASSSPLLACVCLLLPSQQASCASDLPGLPIVVEVPVWLLVVSSMAAQICLGLEGSWPMEEATLYEGGGALSSCRPVRHRPSTGSPVRVSW